MPSQIIDVGGGDLAVEMSNTKWARPTLIGTNWTKLRIALHCTFEDAGGNLTSTPRLGIGMCSGDTNILGDANTDNWVGAISDEATWGRSGGNSTYANVDWSAATRVAALLSTSASVITSSNGFPLNARMCAIFVDITKGSPDFTINTFMPSFTSGSASITEAEFLAQADLEAAVLSAHNFGTPQTMAVDEEANGDLDHVNVWWSTAQAAFRHAYTRVIRFA